MSTAAPPGTPCAHAEGWAVPRAMFTSVMHLVDGHPAVIVAVAGARIRRGGVGLVGANGAARVADTGAHESALVEVIHWCVGTPGVAESTLVAAINCGTGRGAPGGHTDCRAQRHRLRRPAIVPKSRRVEPRIRVAQRAMRRAEATARAIVDAVVIVGVVHGVDADAAVTIAVGNNRIGKRHPPIVAVVVDGGAAGRAVAGEGTAEDAQEVVGIVGVVDSATSFSAVRGEGTVGDAEISTVREAVAAVGEKTITVP